ncbi:MAG: hypothetical protein JO372_01830 [Solirubrobacterales bacterium]|nr:hypothetical protein [Solirubrobacterales bacterium]
MLPAPRRFAERFRSNPRPDRGGYFRIALEASSTQVKQLYLPSTNVLLTRFFRSDGVVEVVDAVSGQPGLDCVMLHRSRVRAHRLDDSSSCTGHRSASQARRMT